MNAASSVRTFGKYLLDEEIARGGMSRVFLARLRGLGGFEKRLVVKQVLPELASDPRFVSMFVQEAKTLVQMSHPHIAPVYELGVVDGVYFLAMEYVDGGTLSQILKNGPLAPELVAHMGAQICDALHYAHDRFGIIHRDVTPRNVIVDTEGHARLLDFGIAAPAFGEESELFGTPGYISPEQAKGETIGPASDVFSLGAVLFEALTARRAFFARTVEEAREVLTMDGPDFYPDDLVPEMLAKIVQRAIARDSAARYPSARGLGRALRSWVAAHAPEGVGPELAERARAADSEPRSPADGGFPQGEVPSEPEVRTLATSRLLDEMLAAPIEPPPPPEVGPSPDQSEEAEPGTTRIEPRIERETVDEEHSVRPGPIVPPREVRPAPESSSRWMLGAAALAVAGAFAWAAWPQERPPHDPQPVVDAPPEVPRPDVPPIPPVRDPDVSGGVGDPEQRVEPSAPEPTAPEQIPRPVARAYLSANAQPYAEVELDGHPIEGQTPHRRVPIRPGRHTIVMRHPALPHERTLSFEVQPGEHVTVIADLTSEDGRINLLRPRTAP